MMTQAAVYAAAALVGLAMLLFRLFRCAHAWELVDKTEFKAPWEDLPEGEEYQRGDLKWLLRRTVILVIRCPKCGAAKVIRESSTPK